MLQGQAVTTQTCSTTKSDLNIVTIVRLGSISNNMKTRYNITIGTISAVVTLVTIVQMGDSSNNSNVTISLVVVTIVRT